MTKEISTQNPTEITTFNPTHKMVEYVDTAVRILSDSPSKVSANCEVDRRSWYDWLKLPGFEDWFYDEYTRRRKRIIPKLDAIGMKHASRGAYQFWEAMNKKVGDLYDGPTSPSVNTFQFQFTREQIERLIDEPVREPED